MIEKADQTTGEVIPVKESETIGNQSFQDEVSKILKTAGTLVVTEVQNKILYEDIKDEEILIRPDGLIYAPWYVYAGRLNKAFGGLSWALIPKGDPEYREDEKIVYWGFHMVINGVYVDFAIGQNEYRADDFMKWGDCVEGAKSNALMRICKKIGMFHKLWDHAFGEQWKAKYAYIKEWKTLPSGKKRPIWAKKSQAVNQQSPITSNPQAPVAPKT